jgi:hypothetical protein
MAEITQRPAIGIRTRLRQRVPTLPDLVAPFRCTAALGSASVEPKLPGDGYAPRLAFGRRGAADNPNHEPKEHYGRGV